MDIKVSVIVPVYNPGCYLRQCLDTLLAQTLKEIEIICVNDGSTDGSAYLLEQYRLKDERIKVILQENKGAGEARNAGLKGVKGEYLIFLDADDFFENDMLEYMYFLAKKDNSDIVECGHYAYDNRIHQDVQVKYPEAEAVEKSPFAPTDFPNNLFSISYPGVCNKLFKTDFVKKHHLAFAKVPQGEDLFFSCQALAVASKISVCSIPFFHYRVENLAQSTSHLNKPKTAVLFLQMMDELWHKFKTLGISEKIKGSYTDILKKSLQYELSTGVELNKRKSLRLIRQILPKEVIDATFFTSDRPSISLVLCVYNMEKYLPECLNSLIHQTLQNIEIICVDDGSTDGSLKILQDYAAKDNRIKVLTQENKKLSIARRVAMKEVTGEYTLYVDADDYLELDACECLYFYSKIYNLDMCSFMSMEFWDETREDFEFPYHRLSWYPDRFVPVFSQKNVQEVVHQIAVTSGLTLYKNEFLRKKQIEWMDAPLFYEDTPFFTEALLRTERCGILRETLLHKRVHQASITQNMETNFADYCTVVQKTLKIVENYGNKQMLMNYPAGFLEKGWETYKRFSPELQKKYLSDFYDLCDLLVKKYGFRLFPEVQRWYDYRKKVKN